MINYDLKSNPMPELKPEERTQSFDEVCLGYTEDMAVREAMRCLRCRKKPCMIKGCPIHMNIPEFVARVAEGDFEAAYEIISGISCLPSVCSRVCPHEDQCEGSCVRGAFGQPVAIGRLERYVCDRHKAMSGAASEKAPERNGHKVAVIGAGPAGISCASRLADKGYDVVVYEAADHAGGVLYYGIPQFRLPKQIVDSEIAKLEAKGVRFVLGSAAGSGFTVDELLEKEGFEAAFMGTGADVPYEISIPGDKLKGVYSANSFLAQVNTATAQGNEQMPAMQGGTAVIVGGGNVAMDAARCARRIGADNVSILYRRSRNEMPACDAEIKEAEDEGISFSFLTNPVAIQGDAEGKVCGIEVVDMQLGETDASGRRRPVEVNGSNHVIPAALVILAIGTRPDEKIARAAQKLSLDASGRIIADEDTATCRPEIFAGGDAVTGPDTVVRATRAGMRAAQSIDRLLTADNS